MATESPRGEIMKPTLLETQAETSSQHMFPPPAPPPQCQRLSAARCSGSNAGSPGGSHWDDWQADTRRPSEHSSIDESDFSWLTETKEDLQRAFQRSPAEQFAAQHVGTSEDPEILRINCRYRSFCDGGGLCSPGRWKPECRGTPLLQHYREPLMKASGRLNLPGLLRHAATKTGFKKAPFDEQAVRKEFLDVMDEVRMERGLPALNRHVEPGQPFLTFAIAQLLSEAGDPEAPFAAGVHEGTSLGIDEPMPRTPLVLRKKRKWRLPEHNDDPVSCTENYPSGDKRSHIIREKLMEEKPMGRVIGPGTKEEIAEACQCSPDELVVSKVACLQEGPDKYRTLMDSTKPRVNNKIRLLDQQEFPGLAEEEHVMQWSRDQGEVSRHGLLKFDIKSAHRLVKRLRRYWRFLVMKLGNEYFANTVGCFGEGSASYWWFRLYACIHRILYYILDSSAWGLVMADDSLWHLALQTFWEEASLVFGLLVMVGAPISWPKTRCMLAVQWVGFEVDYKSWFVGITLQRCHLMREMTKPFLMDVSGPRKLLEKVAGVFVHASQAKPQLKPLLQPIYACLTATSELTNITWPKSVVIAIITILSALEHNRTRKVNPKACPLPEQAASDGSGGLVDFMVTTESLAADLSAAVAGTQILQHETVLSGRALRHTDLVAVQAPGGRRQPISSAIALAMPIPFTVYVRNIVGVGGYWGPAGATKWDMQWFSEEVQEEWVLKDSEGTLADAGASSTTVECLAAAILIDLRLRKMHKTDTHVHISGAGDNKGCKFIISKLYTSAMPAAAVIRFLAGRLAANHATASMEWVPREQNTWADDLSKRIFNGFDLAKRVRVDWTEYASIGKDVEIFT